MRSRAATTGRRATTEEDPTDASDLDGAYADGAESPPDPDKPLALPRPRPLVQVPGFLPEDLDAMAFAEPANYEAHCITAQHSLMKADDDAPILVSRTHVEVVDGQEIMFCLLVFWPDDDFASQPGVLFGEIGISPALYTRLVRDIGRRRPLPQKARIPDEYDETPQEREDAKWAELLGGSGDDAEGGC